MTVCCYVENNKHNSTTLSSIIKSIQLQKTQPSTTFVYEKTGYTWKNRITKADIPYYRNMISYNNKILANNPNTVQV